MLTVKHLSVSYGEHLILSDLSFSLACGFTVLLGQNGAGKTTLLRAVAGTVPIKGEILLDGESLAELTPKARASRLSQVTANHTTLSGILGKTLVEMALYPRHGLFFTPSKEEKERIEALAAGMGIAPLLNRFLDEMSAGEMQLLRLLAASVQDTPLCLLDEPTASLDYNRTHAFLSRAKEAGREKIVLATLHDPALALRYADRILLLQDGKVAGDFTPQKIDAQEAQRNLRLLYPDVHIEKTPYGLSVV